MSRLIDAERLRKDILNLQDCYNGFSDTYDKACIIGVIDEQPTIDPVKWIPVSDGTPAYGEDVLLSIDGEFCAVGHVVQTNDEIWYEWYYNGWYHPYEDVIAWMPLPEPWKGEEP